MGATSAILTYNFDRAAAPKNLLLVKDWQTFASRVCGAGRGVRAGVRAYLKNSGREAAMVLQYNGDLQVFSLVGASLRQRTYRYGTWKWAETPEELGIE